MDQKTIANAVETLEELSQALTEAYWDASDIFQKDTVFDVITAVHDEMNELNKLSIEDHYMTYEPVTLVFPAAAKKFNQLQSHTVEWFPRTQTAQRLNEALNQAESLISPK